MKRKDALVRYAYVQTCRSRRAKFRAVTLQRVTKGGEVMWGEMTLAARDRTRTMPYRATLSTTEWVKCGNREWKEETERRKSTRGLAMKVEGCVRGFDDEHFGVYLVHGVYTHCSFLYKVGRRDAAVFRSNWIYWESSEYRVDHNGCKSMGDHGISRGRNPPSLPPSPRDSSSPAFPPPREPHSRYIFTEMQIALVHRAPRFRIISSRLVRIKVLPWKEEDFGIYRGSESGLDWLYPLKYELLLYRGILPTLRKRLSRTSTRIIFREERQLLWTFHFTVYCLKFLTFLYSRKYIISTNKCVHVCRSDLQEYEKYGKQGSV